MRVRATIVAEPDAYVVSHHRSSYTGEGNILRALQPSTLPAELDAMFLSGWALWQVW